MISRTLIVSVASAALISAPLLAQNATGDAPTAPAAGTAAPGPVGISARDGISFAAPDVLVTRNGVTETLKKEMQLSNGTRILPDGAVHLPDKGKITLRPNQILTFDGRLMDATPATPGAGSSSGGSNAAQGGATGANR